MGKYQVYPEYKNSGAEWLEDLPSHWEVRRTKTMFSLTRQLVGKKSTDYQLLSLTLKGVIPRDISNGAGKIPAEFDTYQVVRPKDLIFCLFDIDETPRTIGISSRGGMITGAFNVYSALEPCVPEYAYYYFLHIDSFKGLKPFYTGLRKVVRSDVFANIDMPTPKREEQEKIANFLDHETAKIDTLIEKQQQLIKLLKEKRQAVISHAVTKGLNPDAPMRDSGVEWLGEVPEHWEVQKFTHCTSIRSGQVDPTKEPYCDFILVAPNHIESGTGRLIAQETAAEQGAESGKYLCKEGEVIYSKIRPALAKVCMSPSDNTMCSADMYPIQGISGLTNDFLFWSLLSTWFTSLVILESDRVAMPKINREKLADVRLPVPPKDEQVAIGVEIANRVLIMDSLIQKVGRAIDLAKERRIALISAAVSGKIDVRNWQHPKLYNSKEAAA